MRVRALPFSEPDRGALIIRRYRVTGMRGLCKMKKKLTLIVSTIVMPGALAAGSLAQTVLADASDEVVEVRMVDKSPTEFSFEPSTLTVSRGTTVRFVMTGNIPHNIQFKDPPEGAKLGDLMMGPFLVQQGQTYDVVVDDRFVDGPYPVVCTPHELMGMKGTLTVVP